MCVSSKRMKIIRGLAATRARQVPVCRLKDVSELGGKRKIFCFCSNKCKKVIVCNGFNCNWAIHPECIGGNSDDYTFNNSYRCPMCQIEKLRRTWEDALFKDGNEKKMYLLQRT
ncbi:uncharacterized protein LOC141906042 [Tubulanus polymorphus]|uniref:uncharacterized protein LOC141906042 n=1 Tax=Tubulanus polymorphus TaxID=672921 RepID=UPI003DA69856